MQIQREIKVIEFIEYDGIRFYRDKKGYWLSSRIPQYNKPKRLHIYVWEKHNGAIPKGYHVHHIDHDTDNNDISNLELVTRSDHLKHHAQFQDVDKLRENFALYAQPKAIEWHKSQEGLDWHKEHYEQMKDRFHQSVTIICKVCGKETEVGRGGGGAGNKFCSNNCKSQYRRNIGLDNAIFNCPICGAEFYTNKYAPAKYCSTECRNRGRSENSKNRKAAK